MALIRTMCALIGAMCAGAVLPSTAAAAWPERPITLLHGFGAGGNGDLTARVVAERLSARLGQSVVVEPKPGAGGRVAAGFVAKAEADATAAIARREKMASDKIAAAERAAIDDLRAQAAKASSAAAAALIADRHDAAADAALADKVIAAI